LESREGRATWLRFRRGSGGAEESTERFFRKPALTRAADDYRNGSHNLVRCDVGFSQIGDDPAENEQRNRRGGGTAEYGYMRDDRANHLEKAGKMNPSTGAAVAIYRRYRGILYVWTVDVNNGD
jgi:hypothetical protein